MQPGRILFKQIDFEDFTFSLYPWKGQEIPLPESILDSVKQVGVLHPPILRKINGSNPYQIIIR